VLPTSLSPSMTCFADQTTRSPLAHLCRTCGGSDVSYRSLNYRGLHPASVFSHFRKLNQTTSFPSYRFLLLPMRIFPRLLRPLPLGPHRLPESSPSSSPGPQAGDHLHSYVLSLGRSPHGSISFPRGRGRTLTFSPFPLPLFSSVRHQI
jgi:hypothetical protein